MQPHEIWTIKEVLSILTPIVAGIGVIAITWGIYMTRIKALEDKTKELKEESENYLEKDWIDKHALLCKNNAFEIVRELRDTIFNEVQKLDIQIKENRDVVLREINAFYRANGFRKKD